MNIQETTLEKARSYFTTTQRGDETISIFKDDMRDEPIAIAIREAMRSVDGDMDYIFSTAVSILDSLADFTDSIHDIDDIIHEIADSLVDIYTTNLTAWLAMNLSHLNFVNDALGEFGSNLTIENAISVGQYNQIRELATALVAVLEDNNE